MQRGGSSTLPVRFAGSAPQPFSASRWDPRGRPAVYNSASSGRKLLQRRWTMRRRGRVIAGVIATVLAASPVAAADRVKVGFIATFSGPIGQIGQHMIDGFTLGVDHAGGKLGGLATEVLREDDQL